MQRHLNLAWTADGVLHDAKLTWAAVKGVRGSALRLALSWSRRHFAVGAGHIRRIVVTGILRDVILRDVEAAGVGQVEHVQAVAQRIPVANLQAFYQRSVRALLEGLPEDVALAGGETGLEVVADGYAVGS